MPITTTSTKHQHSDTNDVTTTTSCYCNFYLFFNCHELQNKQINKQNNFIDIKQTIVNNWNGKTRYQMYKAILELFYQFLVGLLHHYKSNCSHNSSHWLSPLEEGQCQKLHLLKFDLKMKSSSPNKGSCEIRQKMFEALFALFEMC